MRARVVTIGGTDYTADTIADISIVAGRTNLTDPVAPTICTGSVVTGAISTLNLGTTVTVSVGTGSYATRFDGWVISLEQDRYTTRFVAVDNRLGYFARLQWPDYTIPNSLSYSGGSRTPQLYYVHVHRLYTAGLITEADYNTAMGIPIPWTLPYNYVPLTTGWNVRIDLDDTLLQIGANIAAATGLDQLNTLVANKPQGTFTGSAFNLTRQWSSTYDYAPQLDAIGIDYIAELNTDNLLNRVTANYGTSSSLTISDPVSATTYGAGSYSEWEGSTQLGDISGAISYTYRLLASRRTPRWTTNPLRFDVEHLSTAVYNAGDWTPYCGRPWDLLAIQARIPTLPRYAFVEGYTETITGNSHELEVYAFDAIYTNDPETWSTVTVSVTWSSVDSTLTWYDMIGALL